MSLAVLLRSSLFALFQLLITPLFAVVALLTFPFAPLTRYRIITCWSRLMIDAASSLCGIRYRVLGVENIPKEPCIILSKHQSAWETLAFQVILPPHVWVLKRELLWIPFFGWGLAMLSPIAIDRSAGARALRQTLDQGRERLTQGFSIVIFPEGTRGHGDEPQSFKSGLFKLAQMFPQVVLVPAWINNVQRVMPKGEVVPVPILCSVTFGAPIQLEAGEERRPFLDRARRAVIALREV